MNPRSACSAATDTAQSSRRPRTGEIQCRATQNARRISGSDAWSSSARFRRRDDGAVAVVEDREELFAVDVHEETVFAVEMERRGRIRRGHGQETLDLLEVGVEQAVEAARAGHRKAACLPAAGDIAANSPRA